MLTYKELEHIFPRLYDIPVSDINKRKSEYNSYLIGIRNLAYCGHSDAQFDLGGHYEDIGFWGDPNPFFNVRKRFYWYSKAAENNHGDACNNLASLYEKGEGCIQDLEKAYFLYKKAKELGSDSGKTGFRIFKNHLKKGHYRKNEKGIYIFHREGNTDFSIVFE